MADKSYPNIAFPEGFDERAEAEMQLKGWVTIYVEIEPDRKVELYISDIVRLKQDLEEAVRNGEPCFSQLGLVVIPEVTLPNIKRAVDFLWHQNYFV
jgi:hypothetical protein